MRSGIARVDVLLIVIMILGIAAIALPALLDSRRRSHRYQCQNNVMQLTTALINYSGKQNGQIPYLYDTIKPVGGPEVRVPWIISLLPELDNAAVQRNFEADPWAYQQAIPPSLKQLQCERDPDKWMSPGALSYVANTGYIRADIYDQVAVDWQFAHSSVAIDWYRNQIVDMRDAGIATATGVFWPRQHAKDGKKGYVDLFRMSLDYIAAGDGTSNTLLFAENTQAGSWHRANAMHDLAFGVPVIPGMDFPDEPLDKRSAKRLAYLPSLGKLIHARSAMPGENLEAKSGTAPRPSSRHEGTSMYGFADGSAKQIADGIDWSVYVRLLTPNGQRHGQVVPGIENY